jgi:uncharacterized membrane protein YbhN (UPF0104 family)
MLLKVVLECVGRTQPLFRTAQVELCGFFFEQVALGFVGGDAMRLWLLHRLGIPLRDGIKPLLVDRCLGFGALLLLVAIGLPGLLRLVPALGPDSWAPMMIGAVVLMALATPFVTLLVIPEKYRRHPVWVELRGLISLSLRDARVRSRFLFAFLCALATHLLNVLIFFLIADNLELPVSLQQWFYIVPAALLFSMIPISAGGWGLREGIFLLALGTLGIAREEATIVSVLFGLGVLAVTLPGAFVWLSNRQPAG